MGVRRYTAYAAFLFLSLAAALIGLEVKAGDNSPASFIASATATVTATPTATFTLVPTATATASATATATITPTPPAAPWETGPILNQHAKPYCISYAYADYLHAAPKPIQGPEPDDIYHAIEAGGGNPTIAHEVADYLVDKGYIKSVTYTGDVQEAARYILTRGPVLFELDWTYGMSYPINGLILDTSIVYDGHEMLAYWYADGYFWVQNSWGEAYGNGGYAKIAAETVKRRLRNGNSSIAMPVKP